LSVAFIRINILHLAQASACARIEGSIQLFFSGIIKIKFIKFLNLNFQAQADACAKCPKCGRQEATKHHRICVRVIDACSNSQLIIDYLHEC